MKLTYARKCDQCNKGMNEGYVIAQGEKYFCTDECLHKNYTPEQWAEMYEDGEGESYYTSWEEHDHEYIETENGTLQEIETNY